MKEVFSISLKRLRKNKQLSQEQLAQIMGVSVQAVSKWECSLSYPDIELLPLLAQTLGVSVDTLLCGKSSGSESMVGQMADSLLNLPDDGCIRIVQFKGATPLREDIYNPDVKIPLVIDCGSKNTDIGPVNIEIWGSAKINGDISGNVTAGADINCGDIGGNALAGADITCGDVGCDVAAGADITCGDVGCDVAAGADITCGDVGCSASAGANITCGDIAGDVESSGAISCQSIGGNVAGDVNTELKISCGRIEGDATSDGNVTVTGDISGDVSASDICCNAIDGDARGGKITCKNIEDDISSCNGDIHCQNIDGDVSCAGNIYYANSSEK